MAEFEGDVRQIFVNAQAYNTVGHGLVATPSLITAAGGLLEECRRVMGEPEWRTNAEQWEAQTQVGGGVAGGGHVWRGAGG